ncbi:MAG: hypothetical protein IJ960_00075 [Oscillospiraceae bacterium]|nr:hypothetical protein [Oscillospiraceae bacterium]
MKNAGLQKLRIYTVLLIMAILLPLLGAVNLFARIPPGEMIAPAEGVPVVTTSRKKPIYNEITQVVADEDCIYVLYDRIHTVQALSYEGEWLYSVGIFAYPNGKTNIAVQDGKLWICDRKGNLYAFRKGEFQSFFPSEDCRELRQSIPLGKWDERFSIRNGDLWVTAEAEKCLLDRPFWVGLLQNNLSWHLMAGLVIGAVILIHIPCPNNKVRSGEKNENIAGE